MAIEKFQKYDLEIDRADFKPVIITQSEYLELIQQKPARHEVVMVSKTDPGFWDLVRFFIIIVCLAGVITLIGSSIEDTRTRQEMIHRERMLIYGQ